MLWSALFITLSLRVFHGETQCMLKDMPIAIAINLKVVGVHHNWALASLSTYKGVLQIVCKAWAA